MSCVRIGDFKAQQQAAMNLYKLKPKNPYYCWAVMSIILQATRGPDSGNEKKRSLLLSLAQRMMDKLLSENKLEAEQEIQLYILILELQEKYEEILKIIEGPFGEKLVNGTLLTNKLPYLVKLGRWSEVNLTCKKILVDNIDKWDVWKEYINSVFELMGDKGNINNHINYVMNGDNELEVVDDTAEKAHEFICRIVENGVGSSKYLLQKF